METSTYIHEKIKNQSEILLNDICDILKKYSNLKIEILNSEEMKDNHKMKTISEIRDSLKKALKNF